MWWKVGTVLRVCARFSLTVDNASCYPSADSPQTHPRGRGGHPVLQVQAILQRSARTIRLHWWVWKKGLLSSYSFFPSPEEILWSDIYLYLSSPILSISLSFSDSCSPGCYVDSRKSRENELGLLTIYPSASFFLSLSLSPSFPVCNLILSLLEWWRGQLPAPVNLKPLQHVLSPFLWA